MATKAIYFTKANSEYARTATANLVESQTGAETCEFWLKLTSISLTVMPVGNPRDGTTYTCNYFFYCWATTGKIDAYMRSGSAWKNIQFASNLATGTWCHIALSYDGTTMRLYRDGTVEATTQTFTGHEANGENDFCVGAQAGIYGMCVDGAIDELRISDNARYTSNFTAPTVEFSSDANTLGLWHFNDDATDDGPNGYDLTEVNTPTYVEGKVNSAGTAALTGTATAGIEETDVVAGGKTIIITLTNDTWVATVGQDNAITTALIAGITSAQSEAAGWNAVVRANMVYTDVVRTSDTVVTITLSAEATYDITATETITATIPATALTNAIPTVATPTFTVAATVFAISGNVKLAGANVSGATIRAINQTTNAVLTDTTDASGNYDIGSLIRDDQKYHVVVEYTTGGVKYNDESQWDIVPLAV